MVALLTKWLSLAALGALAGTQALDATLYGMNYDLRQGPDWDPKKCKTDETIGADLKLLKGVTKNVRTYSLSDCDVTPVLKHAKALGMTVWLGVWVSGDDSVFQKECSVAQQLITAGLIDETVSGFNVGSEAVYRKDITAEKSIEYLKSFQALLSNASITKSTAITDIIDTMIAHPTMLDAGDVVTINQFPFWERVRPSEAADQFLTRIKPLLKLAGDKQVIITETGWPTAGNNSNASVASPAGSARYLNDFIMLAEAQKWKYYYFQGFDSPYKALTPGMENTVEGSFGLFTVDGKMKPDVASLKVGKKTDDKESDGEMAKQNGTASGETIGTNAGSVSVGGTAGMGSGTFNGGGAGTGGAGGTAGAPAGNGAVHGATGSISGNGVGRDNSTAPGNNKKSGAGSIRSSVVAIVTAVMAYAVYQ